MHPERLIKLTIPYLNQKLTTYSYYSNHICRCDHISKTTERTRVYTTDADSRYYYEYAGSKLRKVIKCVRLK